MYACVFCCVVHVIFYGNHKTRNGASTLENEVKRDGGGKIKRDAKVDGMTSSNRGFVEGMMSQSPRPLTVQAKKKKRK